MKLNKPYVRGDGGVQCGAKEVVWDSSPTKTWLYRHGVNRLNKWLFRHFRRELEL